MRSGLESTSGRELRRVGAEPELGALRAGRPLVSEPGTKVDYSTGNSHVLSAILSKATKASTWQFAQEQLARPLGFTLARWPQDPQGVFFGGNEMLMTPRQMSAFGELYAQRRAGSRPRRCSRKSWIETIGRARAADRAGAATANTATAGGSASSAAATRIMRGVTAGSSSSSSAIWISWWSRRLERMSAASGAITSAPFTIWSSKPSSPRSPPADDRALSTVPISTACARSPCWP